MRERWRLTVLRFDTGIAVVVNRHRFDWWSPLRWRPLSVRSRRRGLRLGPLGVITYRRLCGVCEAGSALGHEQDCRYARRREGTEQWGQVSGIGQWGQVIRERSS